jgi:hypothetical protein
MSSDRSGFARFGEDGRSVPHAQCGLLRAPRSSDRRTATAVFHQTGDGGPLSDACRYLRFAPIFVDCSRLLKLVRGYVTVVTVELRFLSSFFNNKRRRKGHV